MIVFGQCRLIVMSCLQRGGHNIEDELVFANHHGYIFHNSSGLESGGDDELKIVQEFVRRKSQERRPKDKLHAIWYVHLCIYKVVYSQGSLSGTAFRWITIGHR